MDERSLFILGFQINVIIEFIKMHLSTTGNPVGSSFLSEMFLDGVCTVSWI